MTRVMTRGATIGVARGVASDVATPSFIGASKGVAPSVTRRATTGATMGTTAGEVTGVAASAATGAAADVAVRAAIRAPTMDIASPWTSIPWPGTLPHEFLGRSLVTRAQQFVPPFGRVTMDATTNAKPFVPGFGAPATVIGGVGWSDWLTGAAIATLGPNWLNDDPLFGGPLAMRNELDQTDDHVEEVSDQGTAARRKCGRAASKAPVPATVAVDIDLTQDSR